LDFVTDEPHDQRGQAMSKKYRLSDSQVLDDLDEEASTGRSSKVIKRPSSKSSKTKKQFTKHRSPSQFDWGIAIFCLVVGALVAAIIAGILLSR